MSEINTEKRITPRFIAEAAIIAALYVILSLNPLSFKEVQCRFGEALCMTIIFTPAGAWGMSIGCLLTNILGASSMLDTIFGTFATILASLFTVLLVRNFKKNKGELLGYKHILLVPIPTVVVNAIVIPFVLYFGYGINSMWVATSKWAVLGLMALSIAAGEIISCYVFGPIVVKIMKMVEKSN